jgi:hypothetical protein
MKDAILRWWAGVCISTAAVVTLGYLGLLHTLWDTDVTKLSFIIMTLYAVVTGYIGWLKMNYNTAQEERFQSHVNVCWFSSEAMTTMGMIGTVIGFLIMLGPAFAGIDIGNSEKMMEVIADLGAGMSTALTTTLVGLICSLATKAQLVNLEHGTKSLL